MDMTLSSPSKGKGREMIETTYERDKTEDNTTENKFDSILKGTQECDETASKQDESEDNTAESKFDRILERMQEREKILSRNKQPHPWDDKAGTTQNSTSSINTSSDINNNDTNDNPLYSFTQDEKGYSDDDKDFGDLFSHHGEDVEALQPSQFRKQSSDKVPSVNRCSESLINMLCRTSDYAEPDDFPLMSYETENTYSQFRQNGPDLMTRHMFSGRMKGKRPVYVPIYKRNNDGYLTKLKMNHKGRWGYVKVHKLSEDESEAGLELFVEPETKKGYPELEDSKRPETSSEGIGSWLWDGRRRDRMLVDWRSIDGECRSSKECR